MSWTFSGIGRPEAIARAIDTAIEGYGPVSVHNQSRAEFEEARPHLQALVGACVGPCVKLIASGHAQFAEGKKTYGVCSVVLEPLPGFLDGSGNSVGARSVRDPRTSMTLWDHLCCLGYSVQARFDGLWHLLRGHRLHWRDDVDLWSGGTGDIWCEACPDSSDGRPRDVVIWIRHWWSLMKAMRFVCGALGHPGWQHPQQWDGHGPPNGGDEDDPHMVDVLDAWCCVRCSACRKGPTPWEAYE